MARRTSHPSSTQSGKKDLDLGSKGNDVLFGDEGDDRLIGFGGDDDLQGGDGDDSLNGGRGDDTLDGGAGNDVLKGGLGNDTLIFDLSENDDSQSVYNGGNGSDTVRIKLTADRYDALREELASLKSWMSENADSTNSGGDSFETSFGLTIRNIENLEIYVDGVGPVDPTETLPSPANTPPTVSGEEIRMSEDGTATVDVLANDSDADGDTLTVADVGDAVDADGNIVGTASIVDNQIVFTPNPNWSGTATIEYTVDDGADTQSATLSIVVEAAADAPEVTVTDATGLESEPIPLDISAALSDTDGSETLEIIVSGVPDGAALSSGTLNADGTWSLTTADLSGLTLTPVRGGDTNFALTVTATSTETADGDTATTIETIDVAVTPVNEPLALNGIDPVTVNEDEQISIEGLSISDADSVFYPDAQYSVTLSVTNGMISVAGGIAAATVALSGTFSEVNAQMADIVYTGSQDFNGEDTLTITAADQGGQSEVVIPITVTAVNDAPIANADQGAQLDDEIQLYDVLANDTDVDVEDTVDTFRLVSASSELGDAQIVDGQIQFDPSSQFDHLSEGETQEVVVQYTMEDASGAQSSSTLTLIVTGTAAPFVVADDIALSVQEDSGETALGIAMPTTADGLAIEIIVTGLPDNSTGEVFKLDGTLVLAGDTLTPDELSNLVYRTAADAFGEGGAFSYTVSNGENIFTRSVTVDVTPVNDAPSVTLPDLSPAIGDEFQINTMTSDFQHMPSIAALEDGSQVIVWASFNQDGHDHGIFGQRIDAAGGMIGSEFQVNDYYISNQFEPAVAALSGGGFVVTWSSLNQDGNSWGVFGQQYDALGGPVGEMFQANSMTTYGQRFSTVTGLEDGGYVITWTSEHQDGSYSGIYGQSYNSDGTITGNEFRINTYTRLYQERSSVTALDGGGFVVTWESWSQDGSKVSVFGQMFDAAGSVIGREFQVNTYTSLTQWKSQVAGLADGGFVVTWESDGQDGDGFGIFARRYDASGVAADSEFQVNTYTLSDQSDPAVTGLTDGGFVVLWQSEGQDGDGDGIFGQRYDADGVAIDGEFQVNTTTAGAQITPQVSALQDGGFIVTWASFSSDMTDSEIYSRIYQSNGFDPLEEVPISIAGVSVGDIDAGTGSITVTLAVANGTLVLADDVVGGVAGIDIAGNGTGTVVMTGTVDALNATLAATDGLVYRGARDFSGTETLTVTVDDGGNTGSGGSSIDTQFVEFSVSGVVDIKGTTENDLIVGSDISEQITGFEGNDILTGGAGDDMFIYDSGHGADVINDFGNGADVLDLSEVNGMASFTDVMSTATQVGADTVFDFGGGDRITLIGVSIATLEEQDFLL